MQRGLWFTKILLGSIQGKKALWRFLFQSVQCPWHHLCMRAQSCLTLCDSMEWIACEAPLFKEFFRQEYWNGLPFPPPRDLPHPGLNLHPLCLLNCKWIVYPLSCHSLPLSWGRLKQKLDASGVSYRRFLPRVGI